MKKLRFKLDLQFFAEGGGDGAAAGVDTGAISAEGNVTGSVELPANIPEKARKIYEKALKRTGKVDTPPKSEVKEEIAESTPTEEKETTPAKPTFKDLLKDEEYSKEYDKRVNKAVNDRYKQNNEKISRYEALLEKNARKYGIDTSSPTYLQDLEEAMNKDDSFYEKYAEEHDVSIATAKRMVGTEEQLSRMKQAEENRKRAAEDMKTIAALRKSGETTKAMYPNFDLDAEMANPAFMRICAASGGDTTAAYIAVHHKDIMSQSVQKAARQAQESTVNSIKANQARPQENGLSSQTTTHNQPNFKDGTWDKAKLDAYAAEMRKRRGR